MTDIPDTNTLKGMLAEATPGPWCVADECVVWTQINDPIETTYDIGYPIAEARRQKSFWNGTRWPEGQPEANARLIALAPALAARVIEQDARIARLTEALRLHQAWSDSEDAGPDYGAQTRDTHPDGERIWRQWWDGNLDLCARAQEATRAALEDGQ